MARPSEKAMSMLNKWGAMKESHDASQNPSMSHAITRAGVRPYLSSLCENREDCEFWIKQIRMEITAGVGRIQSKGLPESQIRDLNDGINKLLRERYHWFKQLASLGGVDYNKLKTEDEGGGVGMKGSKGYMYFGSAKDLPGVRDLFAANAKKIMTQQGYKGGASGGETDGWGLGKRVNGMYYGFGSENDGVLIEMESKVEKEIDGEHDSKRTKTAEYEYDIISSTSASANDDDDDAVKLTQTAFGEQGINIPIPSQKLISEFLVEQKKKELLSKLG